MTAHPKNYTEIPELDMGPYLAGEAGAREALAAKLRHIQENIGFMVAVNHGFPWKLFERTVEKLKLFFAKPAEEKLKYKISEKSVGYLPPKSTVYASSVINENTKLDLNETLNLALERPADHPSIKAGLRLVGPNPWPDDIEGFRETIVEYQQEMVKLGRKLITLYALALDKPADFFDPYFTDPLMWSRNAHYPLMEAEENQFGIAPHCDHSFLSMLPTSDVPGLQILTTEGNWLDAPYVEGDILINTGEYLNRWSNGRFMPTPHRVLPPTKDRYSIATFFNPNHDTLAVPLDTCCGPDNPAQFDPISMIDYVTWYIDTNYKRSFGGKQH